MLAKAKKSKIARIGLVGWIFFALQVNISVGQTPCAPVVLSPNTVQDGTTTELTLAANGTVDLSSVQPGPMNQNNSFGINAQNLADNGEISTPTVITQTAQVLTFSIKISPNAKTGVRTLYVTDSGGREVVALEITLIAAELVCNPPCALGSVCQNGFCKVVHPKCGPGGTCPPGQTCVNGLICVKSCVGVSCNQ